MAISCPKCGKADNAVVDSRGTKDAIRRRRECEWCGERFTTYESLERISKRSVMIDVRQELLKNIKEAIMKTFRNEEEQHGPEKV